MPVFVEAIVARVPDVIGNAAHRHDADEQRIRRLDEALHRWRGGRAHEQLDRFALLDRQRRHPRHEAADLENAPSNCTFVPINPGRSAGISKGAATA
jgi:hypothetical protein